ncbi:MAG: helix-turn-helix transcriptional regulator [Tardiphaga sp.]
MTDLKTLDFASVDSADGPVVIAVAGVETRGRTIEPHRHSRGQLMGLTQGLLSVGLEDGVVILPAVHAVWLPPHHLHSASSHGPFAGWGVYVAEAACRDLPTRPRTIRTSGLLREAVLRAASWSMEPLDEARARVAEVLLDEIRSLPSESFGLPLPRDPRLLRIARALIADPADERDLEDWASWAAISSRSVSRRFVAETGFTFTAWRQRARLMRALEMLAADVPVTTIALDLGYATASAFISLFRRTFGATPSAYRQRP